LLQAFQLLHHHVLVRVWHGMNGDIAGSDAFGHALVDRMDMFKMLEELEDAPGLAHLRCGMIASDHHHLLASICQADDLFQSDGYGTVRRAN
jgi:hypothetical protein